jgi:transcriptional regulator with XRE-family HTH domain
MARGITSFNGRALRTARLAAPCPEHPHNLTALCLARQIGTSKALILRYEHDRSSPSPQRLADLAVAVGVPASTLQHPTTQLSDLRTACGLTIAELADRLGLAVNTYRRIEIRGVLPKRRPGVFWDLAYQLDVDHTQLDDAIRQIPAVQERRRAAASQLERVLNLALLPGPFRPLQDTSLPALTLAALYGVDPSTVSTVVNILLTDLRQLAQQRAQLEARRDYTAHSRPTLLYERELGSVSDQIDEEFERIPDVLERYLVNPMPQPCWHNLVKLYLAGPAGLDPSSLPADILNALENAFDNYLVEETPTGRISLSTPGVLFFVDTLPYYRVIYVPPERVIRPDPPFYGWPSFQSKAVRRHRLRAAHVLGHDPHPHWDSGSWLRVRSARPPMNQNTWIPATPLHSEEMAF